MLNKKFRRPAPERFLEFVKKTHSCWIWKGHILWDGYGQFRGYNSLKMRAHRFSFEYYKHKIPEGMQVLHTCDNPKCVNPEHLFIGTHKDNMHDMTMKGRNVNSSKTHCKHGHEFTEENTYHRPDREGRCCMMCRRAADKRAYYKRQKHGVNYVR